MTKKSATRQAVTLARDQRAMTAESVFPSDDYQRQLVDGFALAVRNMTIGFLKLSTHDRQEDAESAGTGTLVRIGSVYGVLTASHVLDELPSHGEVGIVRFRSETSQIQRAKVDMSQTERLTIGEPPFGPVGPDIGFLRLPNEAVSWLDATNVFHNLEKRQAEILSSAKSVPYCDSIIGVVAEKTLAIPSIMPNTLAKSFEAYFSAGTVVKEHNANGFDLVDFDPSFADDADRPLSFEGMSGGGLWRMNLSADFRQILDRKLVGVAFYQSPPIEGRRTLTCHGPATIYGPLVDCIRAKWPA